MKISNKLIIKVISFIILDLLVFIFCGVFMMGYDDFYNESQGEYFSLSSMKNQYKVIWVFYNLWLVLNVLLILYVFYRFYKKMILKKI
ncbi:hypothetical protein EV144_1011087 [Flavobacterium sp. 270]|nr:hypothetical protein EV144_1011087 [Flavobacterium sp. 270]